MKKIILILFLYSLTFSISEAQWIQQYPVTVGSAFRDIEFINRNTGWACGDGIIVKTTNSGENWIVQSNPVPDKYLYSISPVDSMTVYCVGWFETIIKTTNGGENWSIVRNGPSGFGRSYQGSFFVNKDTGWICGQVWTYYNILKTTNGGDTWDSTYIFWGFLKDFYFINENTGLVSGPGLGVFKTTNGGTDWERKYIPHWGGAGDIRKLSVINDQYVFVVEDARRVYKSTDFAESWDSVGYVNGADQPYSCAFSNINTGWVGGTYGELFKSTDGGVNWIRQYTGNDQRFIRSFWFYNDSIGWAVGGNTKLLYTTNGGLTFANSNIQYTLENYKLYQNYPNPFNPETNIKFEVIKRSLVELKVYDILGKEVYVLVNEELSEGVFEKMFDGSDLPGGIYFYQLKADDFIETKRMILIK
ncbi:MAG TPA: T9SS type A sorting domain-containing protein [Ignavibacteria bacterium]|nr:T9SS type A sorting domain-containing protein [Ignavibacteria bacterium]